MTSLPMSQARAQLPSLLSRVAAGEEVTITRHGEPVAILVRPDALRVRRAGSALAAAGQLHDLLAAAREDDAAAPPSISTQRAEELVEHIRAARD